METIKIVLIGDNSVGKTALMHLIYNGTFDLAEHRHNIYPDFMSFIKGDVKLQIWDTKGTEMRRTASKLVCRNADMVLICFDLANGESFNGVEEWADSLLDDNAEVPVMLVGTKMDLKRVVSTT